MKFLRIVVAAAGVLGATLLAGPGQVQTVPRGDAISKDANQTPTTGAYSFSGIVVNSATGEPIPRALVTLNMQTQRMVMTAADGRFEFTSLPEGLAIIYARKPGFFTPQETGLSSAPYPS